MNRKELVKAACCNLSEAFETNASVDASFTDAVTGTRQIRMLGLHGKYSQLQVDNMPGPRGLNVIKGLEYIPGDWVHAIHISKGAGSATQGYESITGQINVAMKNPETADPLHANVYFNGMGRSEVNVVTNQAVSRRWSTTVLLHGLRNKRLNDRNGDGFWMFHFIATSLAGMSGSSRVTAVYAGSMQSQFWRPVRSGSDGCLRRAYIA